MAEKQEYRLQVVLDVRQHKKDEAERYLGECFAALKKAQDRLAELEQELVRMVAKRETKQRENMEKAMRGEMTAQDALDANLFIKRMKEAEKMQEKAIQGQKAVVKQKEDNVQTAREEVIKATQELKAMQKHKNKWEEAIKKERESKEEETLDELAQTIYLDQQKP
jgi:flagellar biosynthesis chaperone FliJ